MSFFIFLVPFSRFFSENRVKLLGCTYIIDWGGIWVLWNIDKSLNPGIIRFWDFPYNPLFTQRRLDLNNLNL